jgi:hypothetical protein
VVRQFRAKSAISGVEHEFEPGDAILCESGQTGATVTIEADKSFFLVDRQTFETSCVSKNEGTPFF